MAKRKEVEKNAVFKCSDKTCLFVREIQVIGSGRLTYIWLGDEAGKCIATFEGSSLRDVMNEVSRRLGGP